MPVWLKEKLYLKSTLKQEFAELGGCAKQRLAEAAVRRTPSIARGVGVLSEPVRARRRAVPRRRRRVGDDDRLGRVAATNSSRCGRSTSRIRSGLLYSAFTYYTGFKVNSGEYKLMGLAPYGEPKYDDLILEQAARSARPTARSGSTCSTSTTAPD